MASQEPGAALGLFVRPLQISSLALFLLTGCAHDPVLTNRDLSLGITPVESQITRDQTQHLLTNVGVWSPDGEWIVYDTRSAPDGSVFDGRNISMVNVRSGKIRQLYHSQDGAHCGAATFNPRQPEVVFMHGPEHPTQDWSYSFWHRRGVMVDCAHPDVGRNLDARDVTPPFTPGALRGGSHVHVWDAAGEWVSFTYEDHLLAQFKTASPTNDINQRNVAVSIPSHPVHVRKDHPRNHDGEYFSVMVTHTVSAPRPGSDEIQRACEEGWIGTNGYVRADGTRQRRALAFQGTVRTASGEPIVEVFLADLPEDITREGAGPLCGRETRSPYPPAGVSQRRLTFTADRQFPGLQGPRHWLRCSPDGSRIAFLMKDSAGVVQLWTISPNGGVPTQLTHNQCAIASTFTWSPDGRLIAHVMDNSVCVTDTTSGATTRLTPRCDDAIAPCPQACVFSPDGRRIAFVREVPESGQLFTQIHVLAL